MVILDRVQTFLFNGNIGDHPLPWEQLKRTDLRSKQRSAKVKAIEEHLGVFPDGYSVPLTFRQKLFFKDSLSKLEYKIKKVRRDSREIVKTIESFFPWEDDVKNTRLLRSFILECLSPFKRHTLQVTNATYDEYPLGKSSWPLYIGSWVIISGTLIFFIYWIFAWGVYQGQGTLSSWGAIYGTSAANDILLVAVTKIYVLYYLPSQAMQPQLMRIRKALADISMNYINRREENYSKAIGLERTEISVVQHLSAACRAARSDELRSLPSAWLLRQVRTLSCYHSVFHRSHVIDINHYCTY